MVTLPACKQGLTVKRRQRLYTLYFTGRSRTESVSDKLEFSFYGNKRTRVSKKFIGCDTSDSFVAK